MILPFVRAGLFVSPGEIAEDDGLPKGAPIDPRAGVTEEEEGEKEKR